MRQCTRPPEGAAASTQYKSAPVRREETVGQADLVDGEPGVALQVQGLSQVYLKVAVRAGHSLAAVHVDRGHPFL